MSIILLAFGILSNESPPPRTLDLGQITGTISLSAERRLLPGSEPVDIALRIELKKKDSRIGLVYVAMDIEADDADGAYQAAALAVQF